MTKILRWAMLKLRHRTGVRRVKRKRRKRVPKAEHVAKEDAGVQEDSPGPDAAKEGASDHEQKSRNEDEKEVEEEVDEA